ncbi:MAG: glycosyltransferase [Caulobacteraceae bacterium]|nr:glycosyltransferase [Caulobacteraceae bacterium]
MLKESGRLAEATCAYGTAASLAPTDAEPCLHLAHVLDRQGRTDEAIEVWLEALRRDPGLTVARDALIAAGGRDRLGEDVYGRSAVATRLARLSTTLEDTLLAAREATWASAFAVPAWDAFRRQYPVRPAPGPSGPLLVLVDGRECEPSALRATLLSLIDQRHEAWQAVVPAPDTVRDHPVASLGLVDPRIRFGATDHESIARALAEGGETPVLVVPAGCQLDPEALGWFGFGLARTGAVVLYADHDHYQTDWRSGPVWVHPVLQAMADRHDMATTPHPPAAIIIGPGLRPVLSEGLRHTLDGFALRRQLLLAALKAGPVAHLPRVLTSLPLADEIAPPLPSPPPAEPSVLATDARILVIIPTRDEAAMLARCIETLHATATHPDRLDLVVIDNRSTRPETLELLNRLKDQQGLEIVTADEPFNWARLNTEAAQGRPHDILVFANNDTEMLTAGWDERLRAWLGQADVGVVGTRLLYPDGTLQHGGILLGGWQGRPAHDGLWVSGSEGGPTGRWLRSRAVAAVTGAFMACRRDTFEAIGGFDPHLAIAYNDIDFCLKVRAAGRTVIYAADIELVHHESRTRGHNDRPEKVAWDDSELTDMHRRWGAALLHDPGVNPQWVGAVNRPYDGYRDLPTRTILDHLDASAKLAPWRIRAHSP